MTTSRLVTDNPADHRPQQAPHLPPEHLPFDPSTAPSAGDEREVLTWLLDYQRHVFLRKASGLTEQQVRQRVAPSALTLLGLTRHLAYVEQYWFGHVLLGVVNHTGAADSEGELPLFDDPDDPDIDFNFGPEATMTEALDMLGHQISRARTASANHSFDAVGVNLRHGDPVNLRWIVTHMLEEYARHCGHADFLRESIDGATGD
jgi:hypothetical protein